ncbi:MAG TPA: DUF493 domain-containing protein [Geoalkalibacter subterraneus]|uniref:DUF493 domain-containing protein n=1 Tax=Geoalkalibacter subterraneus TaxID=483547 RepID=A0A831PP12_9BACT|nr:DUF493 domain-containing protein [Geoalkalibacter subterraneus]
MNDRHPKSEELFDFPCDHVFKAVGPNTDLFVFEVNRAVNSVLPVSQDAVKVRPSGKGNYVSVSVVVRVHNFDQVTGVYDALRQIDDLKYLL